jgi:hypothetical protein
MPASVVIFVAAGYATEQRAGLIVKPLLESFNVLPVSTCSVGLAAILNRKYVDRAARHPAESHAPIADSQPVSAGKFALQRFDVTFAGFGVTCQCEQNPHRRLKSRQSAESKTELAQDFLVRDAAAPGD